MSTGMIVFLFGFIGAIILLGFIILIKTLNKSEKDVLKQVEKKSPDDVSVYDILTETPKNVKGLVDSVKLAYIPFIILDIMGKSAINAYKVAKK